MSINLQPTDFCYVTKEGTTSPVFQINTSTEGVSSTIWNRTPALEALEVTVSSDKKTVTITNPNPFTVKVIVTAQTWEGRVDSLSGNFYDSGTFGFESKDFNLASQETCSRLATSEAEGVLTVNGVNISCYAQFGDTAFQSDPTTKN